jgi:hypothetical protein
MLPPMWQLEKRSWNVRKKVANDEYTKKRGVFYLPLAPRSIGILYPFSPNQLSSDSKIQPASAVKIPIGRKKHV